MDRAKKQNLWFVAGLLGIGLILFWRCFYSVNTTDEAFYVGTAYRLWYGDGILCDEWMPSQQLSSFWLIPFYALFRWILGSNDGMILAFRLLYILFQMMMSVYLYSRLKGFGWVSLFSVFFYLLSTAFNINSLSYNTMANSFFLALVVTLAVMEKPNFKDSVLCGIFASIVVMANPYAVFAYVLYGIGCGMAALAAKKTGKELPTAGCFSTFAYMSVTAAVVAVVFVIVTLQNATIEEILENLPYILGDQEHQQRWGVKFSDYFRYFREHYLGAVLVPMLAAIAGLVDKDSEKRGKIYMAVAVLAVLPYIIYHGLISEYVPINLVTVPICFLGLPAYVLKKERPKALFFTWYLPAMCYPIIVQLTSNTGPLAVSAGFMTAGAAAVLLFGSWVQEQDERILKVAGYGVVALQLMIMLFLRMTYVWADADLPDLTTRMERGAAKGLYTTAEDVQYYHEIYDDLDSLNMKEDDGFLVIGADPLLYLYADREVASYSTWQVFTNETRLYRYFEIHNGEGRFPEVVYCVDADETIFDSILVEKLLLPMGFEWKQLQHGIAFYRE